MPGIGWLTGEFSIVDVSQAHHKPSLPILFIYSRLFLSDFELSVLVWIVEEGEDGWMRMSWYVSALALSIYLETVCAQAACAHSCLCFPSTYLYGHIVHV